MVFIHTIEEFDARVCTRRPADSTHSEASLQRCKCNGVQNGWDCGCMHVRGNFRRVCFFGVVVLRFQLALEPSVDKIFGGVVNFAEVVGVQADNHGRIPVPITRTQAHTHARITRCQCLRYSRQCWNAPKSTKRFDLYQKELPMQRQRTCEILRCW